MLETILENTGNGLLAALGISFLIFMHELGHFLAARAFKVKVEVFSIGFGPRLWGRHSGDTDYRLSAIPLGGYVKMAGEYGEGEGDEDFVESPDGLNSKPIWQRFIIFAAGPLMNFALAFVMYPLAFGGGVPFLAPSVGDIEPGGPAWVAGLQPGDVFESINGSRVYGFSDVGLEIALSDPDSTVAVIHRDGRSFEQRLELQRTADDSRYDIGVSPPQGLELEIVENGPSWRAGLRTGDRILSAGAYRVSDVRDGVPLTPQSVIGLAALDATRVDFVVIRDGERQLFSVSPDMVDLQPGRRMLGAAAVQTRVETLRRVAAEPGFPLNVGDVITRVGASPVLTGKDVRDAIRETRSASPQRTLALELIRDEQTITLDMAASSLDAIVDRDIHFGADFLGPLRIQALPDGALWATGVRDGDLLLSLGDEAMPNFRSLVDHMQANPTQADYEVRYERDGHEYTASVRARPTQVPDFGVRIPIQNVVHEMTLGETMTAGFDASVNALRKTAMTLTKLFTGEVGTENLGGPIAISMITFDAASWDIAKLLFFLALLSVNLGFINILPIPVLDGGQMVFLLCEKVKGSRLSERFMMNAQLAGFVAILTLMVYVTFNDILRVI